MASVKGVVTYLEHLNSKKDSLRKAILTLAVEWKYLDEHLDSTKSSFDEFVVDFESRERDLVGNRESLAESVRELDEVRESLNLREEEIECREEKFRQFQLSQVEEFERKEEELGKIRVWVVERLGECELREERLNCQKKSMEVLLEKIEMERKEFEAIQKSVGEKLNEISSKERNYEELSSEVSLIQGRMETWAKELDSREEQIDAAHKLNEERSRELDVIVRECEMREEKLCAEKKSMEVQLRRIELENEKIEDSKIEISLKERNCENLSKEVNLIQDWIERQSRELYSKEEQFDLRETQLKTMQELNEKRSEELDIIARECKLKEENMASEREKFKKIKESVDEKWKEISLIERHCEDSFKEVNLLQDQIERRTQVLVSKEEHVALREEQLREMQKLNKECCDELEVRERECKLREERLNSAEKEFQVNQKSIAEKLNEISLKQRNCEDRSKELDKVQDWIERRTKEIDLKEAEVESREEQCEAMQLVIEDRRKELDVTAEECKLREERLSVVKKSMEVLLEKIKKEKAELEDNKKSFSENLKETSSKERKCEDLSKEVNTILDQIERRARELDLKEKQVTLREEQHEASQKMNEQRCMELDIIAQECKLQEERLRVETKSLEDTKKSLDEKSNEICSKERTCQDLSKNVNLILDQIERRTKELNLKEEQVALREEQLKAAQKLNKEGFKKFGVSVQECTCKQDGLSAERKPMEEPLEMIEKKKKELDVVLQGLDAARRLNEARVEKLDWKEKQLEMAQKHNNECFNDFYMKNKQFKADQELFEERRKELTLKENQLEERLKDFESKVQEFEERFEACEGKKYQLEECSKDFRLKEMQIEERLGEIELKEKESNNDVHCTVKAEEVEESQAIELPEEGEIQVTVEGKDLQFFLNENYKDRRSMLDEVSKILRLSLDPAKLVLDTIEGFNPSHWKKGDREFDKNVVRNSVDLLELLMKLSPQIQPHVREAALRLAGEWKMKMEVDVRNVSEVWLFLLLLASYKLAPDFDANEILEYLEFVARRRLTPEICRALDYSEKVPDLVESLIRKNEHWMAVKFIVFFGLLKKYPPVPLLRDYLRISKKLIKKRRRRENHTVGAQDNALEETKACMKNIVRCIVDHKLECGKWRFKLENTVKGLEGPKGQKHSVPTIIVKNMEQNSDRRRCRFKNVLSYLLTDMDGKNLLLFLSKHVEEHEQMRKDVSSALQMSSDSAKLVLDAIELFYTSYLIKAGSDVEANLVLTCIFLLELLIRILPVIKPQVRDVAREVALDWKLIIMKHTTNELTLGFMLFVSNYGLTSDFESDELLRLYQTIGKHKKAPELVHILGFSELIPENNNFEQSAPEDLQLSNKDSTVSTRDSRLAWDGIPEPIRYVSDPAQLVLNAVEACYYSMINSRKISKAEVLRNFSFLLTRLLNVPLEIKPVVKDQAKKFAADWKGKVKRRDAFEVSCLLLFLATYKVLSSFHADDLLDLLESVYDDRVANGIFRSLGLSDEIPDFIGRLVERRLNLDAIKYIYAFDLVDRFSPITILEGYLSNAKEEAEEILEKGNTSIDAREVAASRQLLSFRAAMDCARMYRLTLPHPFENLEALVQQLEIEFFDLRETNKKRKCKDFLHYSPSNTPFEAYPHKRHRLAALSAEPMLPDHRENAFHPFQPIHPPYHHYPPPGEFPIEPPHYAQTYQGDYFPATSMSYPPYMSQNGPGSLANGGPQPFGVGGGNANFGYYDDGPAMHRWPPMGPQMNWP